MATELENETYSESKSLREMLDCEFKREIPINISIYDEVKYAKREFTDSKGVSYSYMGLTSQGFEFKRLGDGEIIHFKFSDLEDLTCHTNLEIAKSYPPC